MSNWLTDTTANRQKQTYLQGFLDISGSDVSGNALKVCDGNVDISGNVLITTNPAHPGAEYNLHVDGTALVYNGLYLFRNNGLYSKLYVDRESTQSRAKKKNTFSNS
jgi:hypothetical protein